MSDSTQKTYRGHCFCGAVEVEATGEPFAMGYCHCKDCRAWAASPVNAFTLWAPAAVKVTQGEESLGTYKKTESSHRQYCTQCGGHIMTSHPNHDFVDIFSAVLPDLQFQPQVHVNYASTVLRMRDGLPKLRDFPKEMGGSGEEVPE